MKDEREKRLLFKRHKAVRFLISPKKKKEKIEVNKIMNPAFLLGTAFNIAYWHRKSDNYLSVGGYLGGHKISESVRQTPTVAAN